MKICKYLLNEILFIRTRIVPCCSSVFENEELVKKYFIKSDKNVSENVIHEYNTLRNKYIKDYIEKGIFPEFCINCKDYFPVEDDHKVVLNEPFVKIYVNNRSICHCRCVYCCLAGEENQEEGFENMPHDDEDTYDIIPILQNMKNNNLIADDSKFELRLLGGEPTEHPEEIKKIVEFAKNTKGRLVVFTNAINYNEDIADMLKNYGAIVLCSLDCGSKSIYEKVKRVKAFDRVINSLSKYAQAAKFYPTSFVTLKYIICPSYNDNLQELKKFLKFAESIGASVLLSLDRFWFADNLQKKVPKEISKMVKYFINQTEYNVRKEIDSCMLPDFYIDKIMQDDKNSKHFFYNLLKFLCLENLNK